MRAAVLHGVEDLRVEEVPDPVAGPGEIVLAVEAALTCGTDRKAYLRGHPRYLSEPGVLGHEFAGRVAALGTGVTGIAVGDRVVAANSAPCGSCFQCSRERFSLCEDLLFLFGGFAEAVTVPARIVERNLHVIPPELAMEIVPVYEPLACAVKAVRELSVAPGTEVAVLGAGSLGLLLAAVLSRREAKVTVVDPHDDRLELAPRFGADRTVRATRDLADGEVVRAACNDGRGPELVIEAVGTPSAWELAATMVAAGGTVCLFGGCVAGSTARMDTYRLHYEELNLVGSFHHDPPAVAAALELLEDGSVPWHELIQGKAGLEELSAVLSRRLFPSALKVAVQP